MATRVTGKASWFGGGADPGNPNRTTATGVSDSVAGVAIRPGATYDSGQPYLGGYWLVTAPNGKSKVIKQTDIGPNESTDRRIDLTPNALKRFGLTTETFQTDSKWDATYLSKDLATARKKAAGLGAYGSSGSAPKGGSGAAASVVGATAAKNLAATPEVGLVAGESVGAGFSPAQLLAASGVGQKRQVQASGSGLQAPTFAAGAVLPSGAKAGLSAGSSGVGAGVKSGVRELLAAMPTVDVTPTGVTKIKSAAEILQDAGGVPVAEQAGTTSGGKKTPATPGGRAAGAVDWATGKLGHFAESSGSNTGDELDKLQATFGMRGEAWCAMFATTAAAKGGMAQAGKTAGVKDIRDWASAGTNGYSKLVNGAHAGPGDLLMWGNDHVAFVVSNKNGELKLIQGNGSSGKVDRRTVSASEAAGLQAARPVYGKRK